MRSVITIVFCLCMIPLSAPLFAQDEAASDSGEPEPVSANLSVGFEVLDRAGVFGMGVNITSPYFLWERVAVRVRGELLWDNREWNVFFLVKAGLIGVGGFAGKYIRLYGEGGITFIFPNSRFSSAEWVFGGYGHFGFEFFFAPLDKAHSAYFIELGSTGAQVTADRWADAPVLVSGFAATAGYRLFF